MATQNYIEVNFSDFLCTFERFLHNKICYSIINIKREEIIFPIMANSSKGGDAKLWVYLSKGT